MVELRKLSRRTGNTLFLCPYVLEHTVQNSQNPAEAMMSFAGHISCAMTAWQQAGADRLRRIAGFCTIACSILALSSFAVTSAFADKDNDRKINSFFFFTMLQLNVQAIVCRDYVSFDTTSINQKLMQYWDAKDGVSIPRNIFDEAVKEIQERQEKLTLAEKKSSCKEGLRNTIRNYAQMRDLLLYRKLDKGVPPPSIELESVGLQ